MRGQIFAIGVAVATSVTLPVMAAEIVVPLDDPAARTAAKDLLAVLVLAGRPAGEGTVCDRSRDADAGVAGEGEEW